MLHQVVVVRGNVKIDFLGLFQVDFLLLHLDCLLLLLVEIVDDLLSLHPLHFCHQPQHLGATLGVGLVE